MPARTESLQIVLDGKEIFDLTEYRVTMGVFDQPGTFSLTIGHPVFFRYLAEAYPPYTPYTLRLAGRLLQTGTIDSLSRAGSKLKTEIQFTGRDVLAPLVDTEISEERQFSEKTFLELTREVFQIVGIDPDVIIASNEANRKAISGQKGASSTDARVPVDTAVEAGFDVEEAIRKADMTANGFAREDGTPYTAEEFEFAALGTGAGTRYDQNVDTAFGNPGSAPGLVTDPALANQAPAPSFTRVSGGDVRLSNSALRAAGYTQEEIDAARRGPPRARKKPQYKTLTAEVGDTWWNFLVGEYRRVGLFLWATADGKVVLSVPNPIQAAIYRIIRKEDINNVLEDSFSHDIKRRFTDYNVFARNGGGRKGVGKILGKFVDDEASNLINRTEDDRQNRTRRRHRAIRDKKCKNGETADNLARRLCCEDRRAAWQLRYCIQGHTIEAIGDDGRALWTPDTIVDVHDDDFGLYGPLYVEKVQYVGQAGSTFTWVYLMRPEDLFFRNEVESTKSVPKKVAEKGINTNVFHAGVYVNKVRGIDNDQDDYFEATGLGKFQGPTDPLDRLEREQAQTSFQEPSGTTSRQTVGGNVFDVEEF